ncbi:MAG: hypothetical protein LBK66_06210 [Spirochaetaceae bacterium]|jgi:hypothetical protein|nr:hypothetical protein [Spirochaetaceae bacterium]
MANKKFYGIMPRMLALWLVLAGCDTGNSPRTGNTENNGENGELVPPVLTMQRSRNTSIYLNTITQSIRLKWNAVPGAEYYKVYKNIYTTDGGKTHSDTIELICDDEGISTTTFDHSQRWIFNYSGSSSGMYYFCVTAVKAGEESGESNRVLLQFLKIGTQITVSGGTGMY